jgi:uncharacterized protein YhdP
MQLENGNSHTNDLILKSTAAEIAITGSTDLGAKIFNYDVTVRPGVSKALPVIGAIAGGPVGAAAGLALLALLRDSLGEAAEARYTIRGPWSDPVIEPVDNFGAVSDDETNGANDDDANDAGTNDADVNDVDDTDPQNSTGENLND